MWYYYETHIDEKVKKVDELKDHIKNISDRIEGKVAEKKEKPKPNEPSALKITDLDS